MTPIEEFPEGESTQIPFSFQNFNPSVSLNTFIEKSPGSTWGLTLYPVFPKY